MLLCLSSAAKKRYKDDIYRALTMPSGLRLKFRYRTEYIPSELVSSLENRAEKGKQALICYLDRNTSLDMLTAVPCRFALVSESKVLGDIVSIDLELGDYAMATDITALNKELRNNTSKFPESTNSIKSEIEGFFCERLENNLSNVRSTMASADWQNIVCDIKSRFEKIKIDEYSFYFRVHSLGPESKNKVITPKHGTYELEPKTSYAINIVHYSPKSTEAQSQTGVFPSLELDVEDGELVKNMRSQFTIDSPYDVLKFRFSTPNTTEEQDEFIALYTHCSNSEERETTRSLEFELPIKIKPKRLVRAVSVGLIGFAYLFQQTLGASPPVQPGSIEFLIHLAASTAIICGLAYGLKRI